MVFKAFKDFLTEEGSDDEFQIALNSAYRQLQVASIDEISVDSFIRFFEENKTNPDIVNNVLIVLCTAQIKYLTNTFSLNEIEIITNFCHALNSYLFLLNTELPNLEKFIEYLKEYTEEGMRFVENNRISNLNLPPRIQSSLQRNGINTISDLINSLTFTGVKNFMYLIRNLGKKSMVDLAKGLEENGYMTDELRSQFIKEGFNYINEG